MSPETSKRVLVAGGSVGVSIAMLASVLWLGAWAFHQRQLNQHTLRLQRLLEKRPGADAVTVGLLSEAGTEALVTRASAPELTALLGRRPETGRTGDILGKARQWPRLDVFSVGPMLYFLYYDAEDVLRDFVCVAG